MLDAATGERSRLITTDYVIDESCTLTKLRARAEAAGRLLQVLDATELVEWEWIGAERFKRGACTVFGAARSGLLVHRLHELRRDARRAHRQFEDKRIECCPKCL